MSTDFTYAWNSKLCFNFFYIFEIFLNNKNLDHQKYLTINEFDQKVIDKDIQFRLLNATCQLSTTYSNAGRICKMLPYIKKGLSLESEAF